VRRFVESPWSPAAGAPVAAAGFLRSPLLAVLIAVAWVIGWALARRWWRGAETRTRLRRWMLGAGIAIAAGFVLAQAVPYGWAHPNPSVVVEPAWDSPETRALAVRACFDCHSNDTTWPWYSEVAPFSWLAYNHVVEGRRILDFSEWNRPQNTRELDESIREGGMPPLYYRILHPSARLTDAEKAALVAGLRATLAASPPG
jgi:mono/diheme cytochrome c family protein